MDEKIALYRPVVNAIGRYSAFIGKQPTNNNTREGLISAEKDEILQTIRALVAGISTVASKGTNAATTFLIWIIAAHVLPERIAQ